MSSNEPRHIDPEINELNQLLDLINTAKQIVARRRAAIRENPLSRDFRDVLDIAEGLHKVELGVDGLIRRNDLVIQVIGKLRSA